MSTVVNERFKTPFDPAFERQRLQRVCQRFTGNSQTAEDLAQEAVLVGLRRAVRPETAPRDWSSFLFGVARRLCLAWRTRQGIDDSRFVAWEEQNSFPEPIATVPDPLESLLSAEREQLIDHALSVLKEPVRQLLLARYVEDLPLAEIAARWGVSENTATVRVHRGREALRKILETSLRNEAAAHGLLSDEAAQGWRETTLFCCRCGRERLQGRFIIATPNSGQETDFVLRCPSCPGMLAGMTSHAAPMDAPTVLEGVSGFRAGLNRINDWWQTYIAEALQTRTMLCPRCNTSCSVELGTTQQFPGFGIYCITCRDTTFYIHPTGLLYHSEEAQAFWRRFPRMRNGMPQAIICQGRPAILTTFADRMTSAKIEMVFDLQTLNRLQVDITS